MTKSKTFMHNNLQLLNNLNLNLNYSLCASEYLIENVLNTLNGSVGNKIGSDNIPAPFLKSCKLPLLLRNFGD